MLTNIFLFIGLAPLLIIIPLFFVLLNLLIFGLQNRNISSQANLKVGNGLLLGMLLGPLGMIIRLFQSTKLTIERLTFGILRFFLVLLINNVIIIAAKSDLVPPVLEPFFFYVIGITFILRGKNSFQFSTINKKDLTNIKQKK
tara:strand:+ start:579 stop:1007 length:429 start_codon:yes stop_codon:yes gene_type:complete